MSEQKPRRAGEPIVDLCRACKATRDHTVMAVDGAGVVLRVVCDFCGSEHNYRGGAPTLPSTARLQAPRTPAPHLASPAIPHERTVRAMDGPDGGRDFETTLRRVLREELGWTPAAPAEKWRGGQIVLRPGRPGLQEKVWPLDTFFHKVVMVRNRLRTLEQQINASDLSEETKLRLQGYISGCYGSLTSFNVLFADDEDLFRGSGSSGPDE